MSNLAFRRKILVDHFFIGEQLSGLPHVLCCFRMGRRVSVAESTLDPNSRPFTPSGTPAAQLQVMSHRNR